MADEQGNFENPLSKWNQIRSKLFSERSPEEFLKHLDGYNIPSTSILEPTQLVWTEIRTPTPSLLHFLVKPIWMMADQPTLRDRPSTPRPPFPQQEPDNARDPDPQDPPVIDHQPEAVPENQENEPANDHPEPANPPADSRWSWECIPLLPSIPRIPSINVIPPGGTERVPERVRNFFTRIRDTFRRMFGNRVEPIVDLEANENPQEVPNNENLDVPGGKKKPRKLPTH